MEATINKYKRIKGINKTVPLFSKINKNITSENITKVTYDELVELRDNSKLIPGHFYRITDYEFTFSVVNVKNAGHQFDIVLVALSEKELAEEGWAMEHPTDIYDVTFSDGVTKKCYLYYDSTANGGSYNLVAIDTLLGANMLFLGDEIESINEEEKTVVCTYRSIDLETENIIYNYFQNSNLSAWKVWYCLDNDTSRFAWAKPSKNDIPSYMNNAYVVTSIVNDSEQSLIVVRNKDKDNSDNNIGVKLYAYDVIGDEIDFEIIQTLYITEENINIGTLSMYMFYNQSFVDYGDIVDVVDIHKYTSGKGVITSGKGVIYRLIDENNNDCPCDFKNYMFIDIDYTEYYRYILNGNDVHDNKIYVDDITENLPKILLIGRTIAFNNIINSNRIYLGKINKNVTHNIITSCNIVRTYDDCLDNILKGCDNIQFYSILSSSTLINSPLIEATGQIRNIYIINSTNISLKRCEHITMFNCNYVTFQKDYIYNLFAKDIEYVEITSNDTTSLTNKIQYVEILPGIKGTLNGRIIITIPIWISGCTIVKPITVNEITP